MNLYKRLALATTGACLQVGAFANEELTPKVGGMSEADVARAALKLLYGSTAQISAEKDSGRLMAVWKNSASDSPSVALDAPPTGQIESTAIVVLPLEVGDRKEYVVLTQSNPHPSAPGDAPNYCHACSATLGGIVFYQSKGGWKVTAKTPSIMSMGNWGSIPVGQPILIGSGIPAIKFDMEYVGQGNTDDSTVIVAMVGNQLAPILNIPTGASDSNGVCADEQEDAKQEGRISDDAKWCYEYTAELNFVMHPGSDYYDVIVEYAGTDYDRDAPASTPGLIVRDVTRTETYVFDGKKYELLKVVKHPGH